MVVNSPKVALGMLTLNKKIQYNGRVNLETKGRNSADLNKWDKREKDICLRREEKQMDYMYKIKTIASGAMIAMAACATVAVVTADKATTNSQNITSVKEETSTDDGSAPGTQMSDVNVNTDLLQSPVIFYDSKEETQILVDSEVKAEVEPNKEQIVGQPETETTVEAEEETKVEQSTEVIVENETEQPSASIEENEEHQVAEPEFVLEFSEEDYQVLCTIVEAEAGDQDAKGRILVANVIINRVKKEGKFGSTIKEVVFAKSGNTYQFSPTRPGGRYYRVTASELTIECVDRALRGEDYSEGALYFCMKTSTNSWFNTKLQFLFKHQDHYFYK